MHICSYVHMIGAQALEHMNRVFICSRLCDGYIPIPGNIKSIFISKFSMNCFIHSLARVLYRIPCKVRCFRQGSISKMYLYFIIFLLSFLGPGTLLIEGLYAFFVLSITVSKNFASIKQSSKPVWLSSNSLSFVIYR